MRHPNPTDGPQPQQVHDSPEANEAEAKAVPASQDARQDASAPTEPRDSYGRTAAEAAAVVPDDVAVSDDASEAYMPGDDEVTALSGAIDFLDDYGDEDDYLDSVKDDDEAEADAEADAVETEAEAENKAT